MTFLILQILIFLVLASAVGAAAGWLVRNLQAQKTDEAASRAVHDAKSKVPQLESLLRSRDDKNAKLKNELADSKSEIKQQQQNTRQLEQQLSEAEREVKRLKGMVEARTGSGLADADDTFQVEAGPQVDDHIIAELSQEIARLKAELKAAQTQTQQQPEAPAQAELDQLQAQLASSERKYTTAANELKIERDKVIELERERELQNKSLQVLHQQLELERTRRMAGA